MLDKIKRLLRTRQLPASPTAEPAPPVSAHVLRAVPPYVRVVNSGDAYRATRDKPVLDAWLKSVPQHVRPNALAGIYPRIVMKIIRLWKDEAGLRAYFDDLTIDRRGGRSGFPPKVADEIARLQNFILQHGSWPPA